MINDLPPPQEQNGHAVESPRITKGTTKTKKGTAKCNEAEVYHKCQQEEDLFFYTRARFALLGFLPVDPPCSAALFLALLPLSEGVLALLLVLHFDNAGVTGIPTGEVFGLFFVPDPFGLLLPVVIDGVSTEDAVNADGTAVFVSLSADFIAFLSTPSAAEGG